MVGADAVIGFIPDLDSVIASIESLSNRSNGVPMTTQAVPSSSSSTDDLDSDRTELERLIAAIFPDKTSIMSELDIRYPNVSSDHIEMNTHDPLSEASQTNPLTFAGQNASPSTKTPSNHFPNRYYGETVLFHVPSKKRADIAAAMRPLNEFYIHNMTTFIDLVNVSQLPQSPPQLEFRMFMAFSRPLSTYQININNTNIVQLLPNGGCVVQHIDSLSQPSSSPQLSSIDSIDYSIPLIWAQGDIKSISSPTLISAAQISLSVINSDPLTDHFDSFLPQTELNPRMSPERYAQLQSMTVPWKYHGSTGRGAFEITVAGQAEGGKQPRHDLGLISWLVVILGFVFIFLMNTIYSYLLTCARSLSISTAAPKTGDKHASVPSMQVSTRSFSSNGFVVVSHNNQQQDQPAEPQASILSPQRSNFALVMNAISAFKPVQVLCCYRQCTQYLYKHRHRSVEMNYSESISFLSPEQGKTILNIIDPHPAPLSPKIPRRRQSVPTQPSQSNRMMYVEPVQINHDILQYELPESEYDVANDPFEDHTTNPLEPQAPKPTITKIGQVNIHDGIVGQNLNPDHSSTSLPPNIQISPPKQLEISDPRPFTHLSAMMSQPKTLDSIIESHNEADTTTTTTTESNLSSTTSLNHIQNMSFDVSDDATLPVIHQSSSFNLDDHLRPIPERTKQQHQYKHQHQHQHQHQQQPRQVSRFRREYIPNQNIINSLKAHSHPYSRPLSDSTAKNNKDGDDSDIDEKDDGGKPNQSPLPPPPTPPGVEMQFVTPGPGMSHTSLSHHSPVLSAKGHLKHSADAVSQFISPSQLLSTSYMMHTSFDSRKSHLHGLPRLIELTINFFLPESIRNYDLITFFTHVSVFAILITFFALRIATHLSTFLWPTALRKASGDTMLVSIMVQLVLPNRTMKSAIIDFDTALVLHRILGRVIALLALFHLFIGPLNEVPDNVFGICSFACIWILALTSIFVLRRASYTFFYYIHLIFSMALVVAICFHQPLTKTYILIGVGLGFKFIDWAIRIIISIGVANSNVGDKTHSLGIYQNFLLANVTSSLLPPPVQDLNIGANQPDGAPPMKIVNMSSNTNTSTNPLAFLKNNFSPFRSTHTPTLTSLSSQSTAKFDPGCFMHIQQPSISWVSSHPFSPLVTSIHDDFLPMLQLQHKRELISIIFRDAARTHENLLFQTLSTVLHFSPNSPLLTTQNTAAARPFLSHLAQSPPPVPNLMLFSDDSEEVRSNNGDTKPPHSSASSRQLSSSQLISIDRLYSLLFTPDVLPLFSQFVLNKLLYNITRPISDELYTDLFTQGISLSSNHLQQFLSNLKQLRSLMQPRPAGSITPSPSDHIEDDQAGSDDAEDMNIHRDGDLLTPINRQTEYNAGEESYDRKQEDYKDDLYVKHGGGSPEELKHHKAAYHLSVLPPLDSIQSNAHSSAIFNDNTRRSSIGANDVTRDTQSLIVMNPTAAPRYQNLRITPDLPLTSPQQSISPQQLDQMTIPIPFHLQHPSRLIKPLPLFSTLYLGSQVKISPDLPRRTIEQYLQTAAQVEPSTLIDNLLVSHVLTPTSTKMAPNSHNDLLTNLYPTIFTQKQVMKNQLTPSASYLHIDLSFLNNFNNSSLFQYVNVISFLMKQSPITAFRSEQTWVYGVKTLVAAAQVEQLNQLNVHPIPPPSSQHQRQHQRQDSNRISSITFQAGDESASTIPHPQRAESAEPQSLQQLTNRVFNPKIQLSIQSTQSTLRYLLQSTTLDYANDIILIAGGVGITFCLSCLDFISQRMMLARSYAEDALCSQYSLLYSARPSFKPQQQSGSVSQFHTQPPQQSNKQNYDGFTPLHHHFVSLIDSSLPIPFQQQQQHPQPAAINPVFPPRTHLTAYQSAFRNMIMAHYLAKRVLLSWSVSDPELLLLLFHRLNRLTLPALDTIPTAILQEPMINKYVDLVKLRTKPMTAFAKYKMRFYSAYSLFKFIQQQSNTLPYTGAVGQYQSQDGFIIQQHHHDKMLREFYQQEFQHQSSTSLYQVDPNNHSNQYQSQLGNIPTKFDYSSHCSCCNLPDNSLELFNSLYNAQLFVPPQHRFLPASNRRTEAPTPSHHIHNTCQSRQSQYEYARYYPYLSSDWCVHKNIIFRHFLAPYNLSFGLIHINIYYTGPGAKLLELLARQHSNPDPINTDLDQQIAELLNQTEDYANSTYHLSELREQLSPIIPHLLHSSALEPDLLSQQSTSLSSSNKPTSKFDINGTLTIIPAHANVHTTFKSIIPPIITALPNMDQHLPAFLQSALYDSQQSHQPHSTSTPSPSPPQTEQTEQTAASGQSTITISSSFSSVDELSHLAQHYQQRMKLPIHPLISARVTQDSLHRFNQLLLQVQFQPINIPYTFFHLKSHYIPLLQRYVAHQCSPFDYLMDALYRPMIDQHHQLSTCSSHCSIYSSCLPHLSSAATSTHSSSPQHPAQQPQPQPPPRRNQHPTVVLCCGPQQMLNDVSSFTTLHNIFLHQERFFW